ncbi:N-acetyltransferase [Psychromarinibacter sp. C21-152]|uniref:N-acetyltransferase n=1 Tax=Psychromarinibacter sediminicola TaxID=3033385 RepID=A0AAE3T957_9RHOB|nr:N-acetyltransferase [Psychromarinibacter sediminicola]MDF0601852.1 N-acetyltransferase [Psychromarinibacter sediminicola]
MTALALRIAEAQDVPRLQDALQRLSDDLGDAHAATEADLRRAGWGGAPAFRAVLAEAGADLAGAALYSPCFSTVRGGAGIYVSDLWTAPGFRGQGIGRKLLARVWADAEQVWAARFLKLNVYHHSAGARAFYERLGFAAMDDVQEMVLGAAGGAALKGEA